MSIKSFHFINRVFEQIVQQNIGSLQALLEAQAEQTVVSFHLIIAFGVFPPDALCFCGMESGRVFLEETLHICSLQNTVIKAASNGASNLQRCKAAGYLILYPGNYSAFLGQMFLHSRHKIHSVPFLRFLELSVTSTFIGQTFLHFPQETHLLLSHLIRSNEK